MTVSKLCLHGCDTMKKRLILSLFLCLTALALLVFAAALLQAQKPPVSMANAENFGVLLTDLVKASETPTEEDEQKIEADLAAVKALNPKDYAMAKVIADCWQKLYLDTGYRIYLYQGDHTARELEDAEIADSAKHTIVILGFALQNGEMQPELMGRCDAAAAMARSFPSAILVCSGGATGENNPEGHTEAGLMKAYLAERCGIDAERIFIDEKATTTAENAANTLNILRQQGVQTMTVVTSAYHQRRGQVLYSVMAELYRQRYGCSVEIAGNYNYDIESSSPIQAFDARIAASQIAELLELPDEVRRALPSMRGALRPAPERIFRSRTRPRSPRSGSGGTSTSMFF